MWEDPRKNPNTQYSTHEEQRNSYMIETEHDFTPGKTSMSKIPAVAAKAQAVVTALPRSQGTLDAIPESAPAVSSPNEQPFHAYSKPSPSGLPLRKTSWLARQARRRGNLA